MRCARVRAESPGEDEAVDERGLRRLLDVGRSLLTELEPEAVLERVLEVARELTGARYAAIGVLDERRETLERLTTFLGVPIVIEGQAWGNLYLTEKAGGEFTHDDEESAVVLADWAAIAIGNARLYRAVRERRDELERTTRGLETTTEIARALGGETDLGRVLELVVKRSRALLGARIVEIALVEGNEFVIAAVAGEGVEGLRGTRISFEDSLVGAALKSGHLQRFPEIGHDTFAYRELGARSALVTPMSFRNRPVGFLIVVDRLRGDGPFNEEDERLLEAFAASAAIAVATAQHAGDEGLRRSLEASEHERSRWARELHDETLQQLAALRVLLSGARRSGDRERMDTAIGEAIEHLKTSIGDLRSLITDLRPAALDEFGIEPALETLVARVTHQSDLDIALEVDLGCEQRVRHAAEVESTIYRVVQEALTNAVKHARASRVHVRVSEQAGAVDVVVHDDGEGFDPHASMAGFGLLGMRERLALVRGTLDIESQPGTGTTLHACVRTVAPAALPHQGPVAD